MANLNKAIPIVVIFKKSKRKGAKLYLNVYENTRIDDILDGNKRKPIVPDTYDIIDIGVGESFINYYTKKYKL